MAVALYQRPQHCSHVAGHLHQHAGMVQTLGDYRRNGMHCARSFDVALHGPLGTQKRAGGVRCLCVDTPIYRS